MRKRLIGGVTSLCIVVIFVCNMFISASASVSAAVLSVGVSVLLGTLFNQMTGGQGYDFTDAFQDAVTAYSNFSENFEDSELYPIEKIEIDSSKVDIPADYSLPSFGGTSMDKMIIEMERAINEGLESGEIEINVDEQGNVYMPTSSWCTSVRSFYDNLGFYTSKDGTKRLRKFWSVVSPYIQTTYDSWNVSVYGYQSDNKFAALFPYVIQNDQLIIFKHYFVCRANVYYLSPGYKEYPGGVIAGAHPDVINYSTSQYPNNLSTIIVDDNNTTAEITISNSDSNKSNSKVISFTSNNNIGFGNIQFDNTQSVQSRGFIQIKSDSNSWNQFWIQAEEGSVTANENTEKIPLTSVETTINNMGLSGVGTGAIAGTVSISNTGDITVTNELTQAAEIVLDQAKPSDIDLPDSDTIIDKFPFSLPFDIYRLLTLFVAEEKEPIFEVPIQTSFGWSGIDVNVDESFTLDFTQFKLNGIDIVQCLVRTSFNVLFIAFLIKITYKMIHK